MANNPKSFKINKLLATSALTAAMVVASSGTAWAKNFNNNDAEFNNAQHWDPAVAVVAGDDLIRTLDAQVNVQFNAEIAGDGVTINLGNHAAVLAGTLTQNLTLGSVFNANGAAPANLLNITYGGAATLTLNGRGPAADATRANDYTGLGNIDFGGQAGSALTVNNPNADTTLAGNFVNAVAGTQINIRTNTIATSAVVNKTILGGAGGAGVNIGDADNAANLTSRPTGAGDVTVASNVAFVNADSTLTLDSSQAGGAATWTLNGGRLGDPAAADGTGILKLHAETNPLIVGANGAETIGTAGHRLKQVVIDGDQPATVNAQIFAKEINANALTAQELAFGALGGAADNAQVDAIHAGQVMQITLTGAAYVGSFDFANSAAANSADAQLILNTADGQYKIGQLLHANAGGIIQVDGQDATFLEGTKLSTEAGNTLNKVNFKTDQTLTLENGVNLYTANGITAVQAKQGTIDTKGDVVIGGIIGAQGQAIKAINATAAGTTQILDNIFVNGAVTAQDKATIQLQGAQLNAASFEGAGTIEFANKEEATVTGNITATNVKISGANLTLPAANFTTPNLAFGANPVDLTLNGALPNNALPANFVLTTESTARDQNIIVTDNLDTGANATIGTEANQFGNFVVAEGKTLTVNTPNFFAGVVGAADGKGTVTLAAADGRILNAGAEGKKLERVNVNQNYTLGDTFATQVEIADTRIARFTKKVSGGTVNFAGANSQAIFADGAELDSAITAAASGQGIATFQDGSRITKDIGAQANPIATAAFTDNTGEKLQHLAADIYANNLTFQKTVVSVEKDNLKLDAEIAANSTIFDLNNRQLTLVKPTNLAGDIVIHTLFDGQKLGNIALSGANASINANAATSVTVELADISTALPGKEGAEYKLVDLTKGALATNLNLPADKLIFNAPTNNKFVKWTLDKDSLVLRAENLAQQASEEILKGVGANAGIVSAANSIFNPENTGAAAEVANEFAALGDDPQKFKNAVTRLSTDTSVNTSQVLNSNIKIGQDAVDTRISTLEPGSVLGKTSGSVAAEAAGDDQKYARYGAWGSPFYSESTQKRTSKHDGYKAKSGGATIGFDTMANDTMTVGVAFTYAKTNINHKDNHAGDKTKVNSYLFSIYGNQLIMDDYFVSGVATFGSHRVNNTANRIGFLNGAETTEKAHSKYDTMSWGGELLTGYHYKAMENAVLIPTIGVSYNQFNDAGYTEKGTRNQNRNINKKANHKIDAIAGLKVIGGSELSGVTYTPEIHGYIRQSLSNKAPKTEIRLNGMIDAITPKSEKASKTSGNIGTSVTVQSGMMDYSLGYDLHLAKKYTGHQGTLKVRVNF